MFDHKTKEKDTEPFMQNAPRLFSRKYKNPDPFKRMDVC